MAEGRIRDCKRLIKDFKLEFFCMLETKLWSGALQQIASQRFLNLFPNEDFFSNFDCSIGCRILLKWNIDCMIFYPLKATPQLVHGEIHLRGSSKLFITCVYCYNDAFNWMELQLNIGNIASSIVGPWITMGDFNCTLFLNEKQVEILFIQGECLILENVFF